MTENEEYIWLKAQIAMLKELAVEYSSKTIDITIQKLESRVKEIEK